MLALDWGRAVGLQGSGAPDLLPVSEAIGPIVSVHACGYVALCELDGFGQQVRFGRYG